MSAIRSFWQTFTRQKPPEASAAQTPQPAAQPPRPAVLLNLDIAPNDPLVAYFQGASGAVEVEKLRLDSPALSRLKKDGVKLALPLVSQGELIGLLNLGPRQSEQDYSGEDRALLNNLSTHASPAVRVAQLVRQQQLEAQARERMEQELRVARLIQQTLLPRELPNLSGWTVAAHYQPARAVGGDFYDFIYFADGRVGFIIGDVTDKGVPAALVMATTRAILRGAAWHTHGDARPRAPGEVLERANELLCPDIPPNMFVTCLYAILDPATGRLQYANAGHDLPYHRHADGVTEMRATGMPLGLMPGMSYEEREVMLAPDDSVLLYSDGLVEAHNAGREMFGFPRLNDLTRQHPGGAALIPFLLEQLAAFTGPGWEQEDDVTFVTIQRASPLTPGPSPLSIAEGDGEGGGMTRPAKRDSVGEGGEDWRTLAQFEWPSERGTERKAAEQVAEAVREVNLPAARLERLKTAVAEATMNAMEHGNKYQRELPVHFTVRASDSALSVSITDHGGQPMPKAQTPDLDAKLAGAQTPRGWGLFLIEKMVDELRVTTDQAKHTVELVLNLRGEDHGH